MTTIPLFTVTIAILFVLQFFRLSHYAGFGYSCSPIDEGWFTSRGSTWPLFGYFALAFAMLFLIDVGLLTDRAVRSDRTAIAIVVANAVALAAVGLALAKQLDTYSIQYLDRRGLLAWITTARSDPFGPGVCELSRPYLGRWRVASRTSPEDSRLFASEWIDLKYDLTFDVGESPWSPSQRGPTRAGRWGPGELGGPFWLSVRRRRFFDWRATLLRDGQLLLEPWEDDPHWRFGSIRLEPGTRD